MMGRSKKPVEELEEMDLEAELDEAAEMELDSDDAEEIAEALAAEEAEEETSSEEDKEEKKPARKPRARKPRARKKKEPAASLLESMSTEETDEAEPEVVVADTDVIPEAEEKAEPKKRAPRAAAAKKTELQDALDAFEGKEVDLSNPDALREDLTIASVAIQKSMDTMAKQWGTVKEISASVCTNLERVNTMLRETPAQDRFKVPVARPAAITKIAVAVSVLSVVLSIVSLLLSQSARQAAFERTAVTAQAPQPRVSAKVETASTVRPEALALGQVPQKRATKSTVPRIPFVQRSKKRSR